MGRSVDDADMERALRGAAPDVVRSALPPHALRLADNTIDQLLAAPQKILIPERYIPEKVRFIVIIIISDKSRPLLDIGNVQKL